MNRATNNNKSRVLPADNEAGANESASELIRVVEQNLACCAEV